MGRSIRDNTDEAAQAADDYVSEHGTRQDTPVVEIFGGNGCPYCTKAIALCERLKLDHTYKNVDDDEEAFFQLHGRIGSWKTVPQIFWGSERIGGYDDLAKRLGEAP